MPIQHFEDLAAVGVVNDTSSYDLPPNAWTASQNMRFDDGKVTKFKGHEEVFATPTATPHYAIQMPVGADNFWFYNSLTDLYSYDGTNHNTITPTGLTGTLGATVSINWNGGVLGGGVLVMNNGVNTPYQWTGSSGTDLYSDLSNWPAAQIARVLRPFNQYLVAGDIDEGSGRIGTQIMWSHPATAGNVPSSWDYNDSTKDAGTTVLAQGGDYIIDMKPMRDVNIIYKDQSIWTQEWIGGASTFRFRRVFDQVGVLSRRCIADFLGRHFVVTNGDILLHDGVSTDQPFDRRLVDQLFNEIDGTNYQTTFVAVNHTLNEVWICYPKSGQTLPNRACVWNWRDNTAYFRDLPTDTSHIEWGIVDPNAGQTFDETSGSYEDQEGSFDQQSYSGSLLNMLMCQATASKKLFRTEQTEQFDGSNFDAYVERTAVPLGATRKQAYDPMRFKFVREIWPIIEGTSGGVITIKVGYRNSQDDSVTWTDYTFTIGTDEHIKTRVAGRIIDIRFSSDSNITWSLIRYSVVYEMGGER